MWHFIHHIQTKEPSAGNIYFDKVINEVPVNRFIYDSEQMVLWNHVIHAKELHLLSFLICILSHHK